MEKKSLLERAREVLRIEAEAITALQSRLGPEFEKAISIILQCEGRVIVTGMGKPGIIGKKFSATLASTGTPSMTVHPADALHGDLGMVTSQDVVVVISNSGETEEIVKLLPLIKKIGALLIAMTGNPSSVLARHADCVLDVGVEREACPFGIAPTASTTAALALSDALAIGLLEAKGFKQEDFAFYHPGGSIGRQLLKVRDVMRTGDRFPMISKRALVKDVLLAITRAKAGAASIVDEAGFLVGIFTDGDLRRSLDKDPHLLSKPVEAWMTKGPIVIGPDSLAAEALRIIKDRQIDELPVVDSEGKPLGIVDERDLLGIV